MKKIPTVYVRDFGGTLGPPGKYVLAEVHPDCGWVIAGEGVATRKLDGAAVLIQDGAAFKRREVKAGQPEPKGFVQVEQDEETDKRVGWLGYDETDQADRWLGEAFDRAYEDGVPADGTYELIGPKVQGNPERAKFHVLRRHGDHKLDDVPVDYEGLVAWLREFDGEGIVWHHPDGRMAKIKVRDFPS